MTVVHLNDDAGRAVCPVCFHVAQAMIFEREGRVLKTHRGVQTELNRLMRDDPRADGHFVGFLARAYTFKTVADYGFDTPTHPTDADVGDALRHARRFFDPFTALLSPPPTP